VSAGLVLGPMTRYADQDTVTVWVETSSTCQVEVRTREGCWRARSFEVEGHHYALVVVDGLTHGADLDYSVWLDARQVWPEPGGAWPASRLRTREARAPLDVVYGSCRVDRPDTEPWTLEPGVDRRGVGVDALAALALACARRGRPLPDLLLLLGDQVYADEGLAPLIRQYQISRRGPDSEPRRGVADFEEYTWLYRDSWTNPAVRWLLSTVPSAMVFDDHDVHDDWNTSRAWRREMTRAPWWRERLTGGYMAYWLYQHLGNVSPRELADEGLLPALQEPGSRGQPLRAHAERADDEVGGRKASRWSYVRDLGSARLVVVDCRSGRILDSGDRSMMSESEWEAVELHLRGDCTHLLVATSLPLLLERAVHDLQGWDEAVAGGAWGERAARYGEWLRQAADIEHWAAFRASFDRLVHRLGEVGAGRCGEAPSTVLVLSGDVHHSYVPRPPTPSRSASRARWCSSSARPCATPSPGACSAPSASRAPGPRASWDACSSAPWVCHHPPSAGPRPPGRCTGKRSPRCTWRTMRRPCGSSGRSTARDAPSWSSSTPSGSTDTGVGRRRARPHHPPLRPVPRRAGHDRPRRRRLLRRLPDPRPPLPGPRRRR